MLHDQVEWVGCDRFCFWDISKERDQILLFYIDLSVDKLLMTLQSDIQFKWDLHQKVAFSSGVKITESKFFYMGLIFPDRVTCDAIKQNESQLEKEEKNTVIISIICPNFRAILCWKPHPNWAYGSGDMAIFVMLKTIKY